MKVSHRTFVALAVALLFLSAACGAAAGEEGSGADEKLAALVAEVGPDWEIVTDYMKRQREWMQGRLNSLGSAEDSGSPEGGEEGFRAA